MQQILVISNGHGEDAVGCALATALTKQGFSILALPLVGQGNAYEAAGFAVAGPRKNMPSGGFVLDDPKILLEDIRHGFFSMTFNQIKTIRQTKSVRATLVVGDIYALGMARFFGSSPLFQVQPRVSLRAWGADGKRVDQTYVPAEISLMRKAIRVYPRDLEGQQYLRSKGIAHAEYLGNPIMDAVTGNTRISESPPYLLLLPGSRRDAHQSLPIMLEASRKLGPIGLKPVVAWAGIPLEGVAIPGWKVEINNNGSYLVHNDGNKVLVVQGGFKGLVLGAKLAVSTSGTAAEQVAGMGIPLIGFATNGPQYTRHFAESQKRMLTDALTLCDANPESVANSVLGLLNDSRRYRNAQSAGRNAMGERGASAKIAADITRMLEGKPPS